MQGGETWDAFYDHSGDGAPLWSGQPNGSLVAEVADLEPGTALDVGCGEGADAIWLAQQGWKVTALDPSAVALDRAVTAAATMEVTVTWMHGGLLETAGELETFDLVSVQYGILPLDTEATTASCPWTPRRPRSGCCAVRWPLAGRSWSSITSSTSLTTATTRSIRPTM
jgi:SAM-dependent methyltransferase